MNGKILHVKSVILSSSCRNVAKHTVTFSSKLKVVGDVRANIPSALSITHCSLICHHLYLDHLHSSFYIITFTLSHPRSHISRGSSIPGIIHQVLNISKLGREKPDARLTMTLFLLEDALSKSSAGLLRRDELLRYILETKIPGAHYHHGKDDVGSSTATMTPPENLNTAGIRPRLVDAAHEDHIIPGYDHLNSEEWSSHDVVFKILEDQGLKADESIGGHIAELPVKTSGIFHSQCLEYLEENGPNLLKKDLKNVEKKCSMLLSIADNLQVLTPPNDPLPWDILNMSRWKKSLCELMKEMKTVKEKCSPLLIRNPGVYVLTTSPYDAFLRTLAAEIADAAGTT